jgi:hypothetical protein
MEYQMLEYFAKFPFVICQLHFVKLLSSHCHYLVLLFFFLSSSFFLFSNSTIPNCMSPHCPSWLFLFVNSTFPNCKVDIAPILNQTSPCLNFQLYFAILPDFQVLFFYFAKLPNPVQPMDCPSKLQAVHKLIVFGDVQGLNFVFGLLKCLPQKIRLPL